MKRFALIFLAVSLLLCGSSGAENAPMENADIQEQVITLEDAEYSLEEELTGLMNVLHSDEFRDLLNLRDVQDILQITIRGVGSWLLENRDVSMKILKELGIKENEQQMVSEIWDSADRIGEVIQVYAKTRDGQRLSKEFDALLASKEWKDVVADFIQLGTSKDFQNMFELLIRQVVQEGLIATGNYDEEQIAEAHSNIPTEEVFEALMEIVDQSQWSQKSLAALMQSELFRTTFQHLCDAMASEEMEAVRLELIRLLRTEEIPHFASRVITAAIKSSQGIIQNNPTGGDSNE